VRLGAAPRGDSQQPPFDDNPFAVLNATGKIALQNYLDLGGNFVAGAFRINASSPPPYLRPLFLVHAASDCMLTWPTMTRTIGEMTTDFIPSFLALVLIPPPPPPRF